MFGFFNGEIVIYNDFDIADCVEEIFSWAVAVADFDNCGSAFFTDDFNFSVFVYGGDIFVGAAPFKVVPLFVFFGVDFVTLLTFYLYGEFCTLVFVGEFKGFGLRGYGNFWII